MAAGAASAGAERGIVLLRVGRAGCEGGGCVLLPAGRPGFLDASAAAAGLAAFLVVVVLGMLCGRGGKTAGRAGKVLLLLCVSVLCVVGGQGRGKREVSAHAGVCVTRSRDVVCMPRGLGAVGLATTTAAEHKTRVCFRVQSRVA